MDDLKWTVERQLNMLEYVLGCLNDLKHEFNNNTYNEALGYLNEAIDSLQEVIEQ